MSLLRKKKKCISWRWRHSTVENQIISTVGRSIPIFQKKRERVKRERESECVSVLGIHPENIDPEISCIHCRSCSSFSYCFSSRLLAEKIFLAIFTHKGKKHHSLKRFVKLQNSFKVNARKIFF